MKRFLSLFLTAAMAVSTMSAQKVVHPNDKKGSYASYTPLELCNSEFHEPGDYGFKGDQSKYMQYRKLYLREEEGKPIPTNDWWTNLITQPYSGRMWSYPQFVQAQTYGVDVQAPSYWISNATEMKSNTVVSIKADGFNPKAAIAESWHDWDVEFSMTDGDKQMFTTMAHGMPFTWIEMTGINEPEVSIAKSYQADGSFTIADAKAVDASGTTVTDGEHTGISSFCLQMGNDVYGIYLPANSTLNVDGGKVTVTFSGDKKFVVVAMLHNASELTAMAKYAYSVPRETRVDWNYADGNMKTTWNVDAVDLRTGGSTTDVLQGFMPHQYRGKGVTCNIPFINNLTYATPHGKLKMAAGVSLVVDYKFYGMLPYYAVPNDVDRAQNPYSEEKMLEMLNDYAATGTFGTDTYWGGKGLTQMALNMMFAREMGQTELFNQCRDKLKAALVNWLTYTPGERTSFFARYDRWGAMVGYATSYDSDTFNDHHFHYGYFTYAAALLALVDDDFRYNYGDMITEIAKDYANWDRNDNRYPMFRTFDPWAGHSFAGGMGDDNGNGQESTSEAMQGWGGLYLLGVALDNKEMRDAGIFGWVSEARGTAEYWFDRHEDNITDWDKYHTEDNDEYNIKYSSFLYNENKDNPKNNGKHLPYNSNLTCHGVGFWTYFGYDAIFMQGIQWMPVSPALDYLSEDKAFAAWDYKRMDADRYIGGWYEAQDGGWLGDGDWGNVALSYLQRSDPDEAAKIFDDCWTKNIPVAKTSSTRGITYFVTHSHLTYGDIDWTVHANIPTARVYVKNGVKTYMAFNPTNKDITVTFSDGGTLAVPARRLAVSGVTSRDNTQITPIDNSEPDPREEIEMVNLALNKPVVASGYENDGMKPEKAVDGDDTSRWGSAIADNQWIYVNLEKAAYIYKVKIHWEAAYPKTYEVQISDDGKMWNNVKAVNCVGGWESIMMNDVKAQYIRINCGERQAENWGCSMWEFQVFGQYADAGSNDILGFKITSDDDVLKQKEPSQLHIKAYTCGKQWIDVTPTWSTDDGDVTSNGEFTPSVYPRATVSATVDKTTVSKTFPVEEAIFVGYLELAPNEMQIPIGESYSVEVNALDQFKGPIKDYDLDNITWKVLDKNGKESDGLTVDAGKITANSVGEYKVVATVDGKTAEMNVNVVKFTDMNLALNKNVTASSQNGNNTADKAVDGAIGNDSRWESQPKVDPQDFTVDLGEEYYIDKVVVHWEAARAKEWDLQVSTDGKIWNDIRHTNVGTANSLDDEIVFDEIAARYVRMHGTSRVTDYGYSIYEFEVYGIGLVSDFNDETAPIITNAEFKTSTASSATFAVTATDDIRILTYKIEVKDAANNIVATAVVKAEEGEETLVTVDGLEDNTEYAATLTVSDLKHKVTKELDKFKTLPIYLPHADAIKEGATIYFENTIDGNPNWRGFLDADPARTGLSAETAKAKVVGILADDTDTNKGDKVISVKNDGVFGFNISAGAELRASYEKSDRFLVCMAVYPVGVEEIQVSPRYYGVADDFFKVSLKPNQWNYITVTPFKGDRYETNKDKISDSAFLGFVFKGTEGKTVYFDNFYKTDATDTQEPVITVAYASDPHLNSATFTLQATDKGNNQENRNITYRIYGKKDGVAENVLIDEITKTDDNKQFSFYTKKLDGNTEYTITVKASDDANNAATSTFTLTTAAGSKLALRDGKTLLQIKGADKVTDEEHGGLVILEGSLPDTKDGFDAFNKIAAAYPYGCFDVRDVEFGEDVKDIIRGGGDTQLHLFNPNAYFITDKEGLFADNYAIPDDKGELVAHSIKWIDGDYTVNDGPIAGVDYKAIVDAWENANAGKSYPGLSVVKYIKLDPYTGYDLKTDDSSLSLTRRMFANYTLDDNDPTGVLKRNRYSTVTCPFEIDVESMENCEFFTLDKPKKDGDKVTLNFTKVEGKTEANKPYLIRVDAGDANTVTFYDWNPAKTIVFPVAEEYQDVKDGIMLLPTYAVAQGIDDITGNFFGTYKHYMVEKTSFYTLSQGNESLILSNGKKGIILPAFRAAVELNGIGASEAKNIIISVDGETTGVTNIETITQIVNGVYSIDGKKLTDTRYGMVNLPAGIYIVNGKKVVIR